MDIAALIAGLGAVALYLLCFQLKSAKSILACKLVSSLLYVIQYLLLFAFVGAAMDLAALITTGIAYKKDMPLVQKYKIPLIIISFSGIVGVGVLLFDHFFSLFAVAGVLLESAAGWMKKEQLIRVISLFAVPCWLVYNLVCGAYGSAVGSVLAFASIIISLIKYSRKKSDSEEVESEP